MRMQLLDPFAKKQRREGLCKGSGEANNQVFVPLDARYALIDESRHGFGCYLYAKLFLATCQPEQLLYRIPSCRRCFEIVPIISYLSEARVAK